jgi:hypothetical protein
MHILNRSEMKQFMAGDDPTCADTCNSLYGGYYDECYEFYAPGSSDLMVCLNEVHGLHGACHADCWWSESP